MRPTILHAPPQYNESCQHYLIFFITGNPGLIGYYKTFLETLNHLISSNPPKSEQSDLAFHIFGQSLPGFEDDDYRLLKHPTTPYGLVEEIGLILETLKAQRFPTGKHQGGRFDGIILIGHSVGAYILLELIRTIRGDSSLGGLKIKAGVLLFPTVTHIAQSPSGVKINALFHIPSFPRLIKTLAKGLLWPLPRWALKWLVALVTRMPPDAAEVTTCLLTSDLGIWQAFHMAKDEMALITEDRWDEDIWGVEHPDPNLEVSVPKLIFYFGEKDHWVANHTRDALITERGQNGGENEKWKPRMLIDQDGIPHGFCINHGELVAEKVKVWIDEIVKSG